MTAPSRQSAGILLFAALLFVLSAGCSSSPVYNWRAENALGYRIGPGDKLQLLYPNHKDIETTATVRPDGLITVPLINDVIAIGRSADEIAADVRGRLVKTNQLRADDPNPLTVQVLEVKSYKIYIIGEVQKPGDFSPTQPVTVIQGLAMAGGFTRFANPDRIVVVRRDVRGERRIPFDYSAVIDKGDLQQNLVLQLGDTVIVP